MPYESDETIEQTRARLAIEEARREGLPTPEEISERAAAIRGGWVDENGVLKVSPNNEGGTGQYQPGIREVSEQTDET